MEARALRRPTTGTQAAEEAGPQELGTPQEVGAGGEAAAGGVGGGMGGGMGGGDQLSRAPTQRAEPLVCEVLERENLQP